MGWLIALGMLLALAVVPLGLDARYSAGGFRLRAVMGPAWISLYPRKKKVPKKRETAQKKEPAAEAKAPAEHTGGSWKDFLPLVRTVWDFLGDFRRKLRVDRLVLEITLAGDDPCDLAVNYGRAWAALEGLMPQAERFFNIRKRSTWIGCDFTARETVVYMGLRMTMPLYRLLGLGLRYGFRVLKEYMNIKKNKAV